MHQVSAWTSAKLFWATTAYNITDGSMPETDQLLPSKNILGDTVENKDGTIDMWYWTKGTGG